MSTDLLLQSNGGVVSRDAGRHTGAAGLFWQNVTNANDGNNSTSADCGGGTSVYEDYLKGDLGAVKRVTSVNLKGGTPNDFAGLEYWNGSAWAALPATWDGVAMNNPAGSTYTINAPGYLDAQLFAVKAAAGGSSPGLVMSTWAIFGDPVPGRTTFVGIIG